MRNIFSRRSRSSMLRPRIVLLAFLYITTACIRAEFILDSCDQASRSFRRLGSLSTVSSNIVVDETNAADFNGDSHRYKREVNAVGFVSYISQRGFVQIEVTGFVFNPSVTRPWSISISTGTNLVHTNGTRESVFKMTERNISDYQVRGGSNDWMKFSFVVRVQETCPKRVNVILDGSASNNEYPGWGVQLSDIVLVNSWYDRCQASCRIHESTCASEFTPRRFTDPASNFLRLKSRSSNIRIDRSNPNQYYNGDHARFKRSNANSGEIVYRASRGIKRVEVEYFQYESSTATSLALFPYVNQNCQPIRLEPNMRSGKGQTSGGWVHRVAHFDLTALPFCATHVSIHISGGVEGWELQISIVRLTVLGEIAEQSRDPSRTPKQPIYTPPSYNPSSRSSEPPTSTRSATGGKGGSPTGWWIWVLVLIGVIAVFVFGAFAIRTFCSCVGDDDHDTTHHIPNWIPGGKSLKRARTGDKPLAPPPPLDSSTKPIKDYGHSSFSFSLPTLKH
eukprot:g5974.t1